MENNPYHKNPAEGDQQACGLNRTKKVKSYPNPLSEKRALQFLVHIYHCHIEGRDTPMSREERDYVDRMVYRIRYGLAKFYPRTGTFELCGLPEGYEEWRLRMKLMNPELIPDDLDAREGRN
jgi:hypothetical protein